MGYWKKLLSTNNFVLAWRRVNTGANTNYKRFFKEAYLAYEVALDSNIGNLIKRIKNGVYTPHRPDKIYIPKPSGLQRPISLLSIEDQIIWQAFANVLELKWKERRSEVEKKVVFSNHPNPNRIFFFENWKISYPRFMARIKEIYSQDKWVAHFDLAAYFDTISHDHIVNLIAPRSPNSEIAVFLRTALRCWSSEKISQSFSHGIPQGPIASSYIGELVFLDIDKPMLRAQERFFYLRYVDDVRLLAGNKDGVREGMILLEQLCRNKGLIPQAKKTIVFYAQTEEDAIGKDFSLMPEEPKIPISDELLLKSVDTENNEIINIARFKFFLFRGQAYKKHIELILTLFVKYPDLSDAFVVYLSRFENDKKVVEFLKNLIKTEFFPYQYFEGNVWFLLSKMNLGKGGKDLLPVARRRIFNRDINFYLKFGLLKFLASYVMSLERGIYNKYLYEDSSVLQALLLIDASIYFDRDYYISILRQCLKRTKPDAGLVSATRLALDDIKFKELGYSKRVKSPVRNTLVSLGLAKSKVIPEITPFQEIFLNKYKINVLDWKPYLKKEYKHAHKILVLAEKAFEINRTSWICSMDSFNEILVRALIKADKNITQKLVNQKGELVPYGNLLDKQNDFSQKYITITDILREVHERRCTVPEAHPYEKVTAKRATFLKLGERNYYYGMLKRAYVELDKVFQGLSN